jgi:sugar phosphate isomerase/epimerase
MKGSMVGIFNWYGIPQTIEKRIKAIKKAGFDSTSMWIDEDGHWEVDPDSIPALIRDSGLYLEYAHAPYSRINTLWDSGKAHDMEEELRKYIDYCSRHRVPILVIHVTKGFRVKEANETGLGVLRNIVRYAKDKNVLIAAENTKQNKVLETVFESIDDKTLGLCFDTSHDNIHGDPKLSLLEQFHDRLQCFHISDNDGLVDDHWLPHQGKVDWDAFVSMVPKEYKGILNLEVLPKEKGIAEEVFLQEAHRVIREIERKIM